MGTCHDLRGRCPKRAQKEVVRRFYKEMWDHADLSLIPEIFHEGFTFRGSLGPVLVGRNAFADYVRWVTGALGNYTSDIIEMTEEDKTVSGKLRFHGYHREELFGVAPTGRHVWWYGAPIFKFEGVKVKDLWVLRDIHGLMGRLKGEGSERTSATYCETAATWNIGLRWLFEQT